MKRNFGPVPADRLRSRAGLTRSGRCESGHACRESVSSIAEILNVEFSQVLELLPDGRTALLRAGVGWGEGSVGVATEEAGAGSPTPYVLEAGEAVIVPDLAEETRFPTPAPQAA